MMGIWKFFLSLMLLFSALIIPNSSEAAFYLNRDFLNKTSPIEGVVNPASDFSIKNKPESHQLNSSGEIGFRFWGEEGIVRMTVDGISNEISFTHDFNSYSSVYLGVQSVDLSESIIEMSASIQLGDDEPFEVSNLITYDFATLFSDYWLEGPFSQFDIEGSIFVNGDPSHLTAYVGATPTPIPASAFLLFTSAFGLAGIRRIMNTFA